MPEISLYVVHYRSSQVHSTVEFSRVAGKYILFEDGSFADTSCGAAGGPTPLRFVQPEDPEYVPAGHEVGTGIMVIDVTRGGEQIVRRTTGKSEVTSGSGITVNLGDPGAGTRGVQIGENLTQINRFS